MGLFRSKAPDPDADTRPATKAEWEAFYDEQAAAGGEKGNRMSGRWWMSGSAKNRIIAPDGRTLTRTGDGCCGCGHHKDAGEHRNAHQTPRIPKDWHGPAGSEHGSTKWRPKN